MSIVPVFLVIYTFLFFVKSDLSKEKAGPYDIVGVSLNHCEDEGTREIEFTIKNKKSSLKSSAFSANITIKTEIGDNVETRVSLDQFTNNGWKIGYFKTELKGACSAMTKFVPAFKNLILSGTNITDCPFPPGEYSLVDISFDTLKIPSVPTFFYNKYRMNIELFINDTKITCLLIYMEAVPKRRKNKQ